MSPTQTVYTEFSADLRRWFSRRAPAEDVDDLLQESFLRVHKGLANLRAQDKLAPWIYRVARSVLIDHVRRSRPAEELDREPADPTPFPEPDKTAMVASWLPGFIDSLPDPYREPSRLSELEGLTQKQVAERLGLSHSGARTRVQRGRKLLRQALLDCCHVEMEGGSVVDVRPCTGC